MASASSLVKVGVVGYGNSAKRFHLPFIQAAAGLTLVAILQRTEAPGKDTVPPGQHCTVDHPSVRHHRTADEFFADADIDLVVVATRNDSHAPLAKLALQAGKHVIVDKPFALSTEEADDLIELAERKGLIVTCYQNRRWDGDFQTLRYLVSAGALGTIKEAEIHYDFESAGAWFPKTEDGYIPGMGMSFGLGSHTIDQALILFGRPKSVTGFFRAQRGVKTEVEDSFTIILQYDSPQQDLLVTIKSSVTTIMAQQLKHIVRGTKGSYFKTQQRSTCCQEEQIEHGLAPLDSGFGIEPEAFHGTLTTLQEFDADCQKYDEGSQKFSGRYPTFPGRWLGIYENLAAAVKGVAELEVKATQVRDALRVIELARMSHCESRTVDWS